MRLTLKATRELTYILKELKTVAKHILKDSIYVCTETHGHTSLDYINKKTGHSITPFNKEIGTELCYLYNSIKDMKQFISNNRRS